MDFELNPVSDAGRIFVDLCESHQDVFSSRAAVHDRDGSFPTENFADLARSGIMAATVPAELGGLGVSDLRDQVGWPGAMVQPRSRQTCISATCAASRGLGAMQRRAAKWLKRML